MTGQKCAEGCRCGRHHPHRVPAPVPYVLTVKAVRALARWDAWRAQHEKEDSRDRPVRG